MSGRTPAVVQVGKGLLQVSLKTIAAIGSATGNVWLAGAAALPDALRESETVQGLLGQRTLKPLTLPVPPFWTGSAQAWQSTCAHIEHHCFDILQDVEKQLQGEKTAPTQQMVRQALIGAVARHMPTWEVPQQERGLVADYLAPLLLQHIATELKAVVDPIRSDKVAEMVTQVFQQLSVVAQPVVSTIPTAPTPVAPAAATTTTPATQLQQKLQDGAYDVFLCYAEADEHEVMKLADQLKARGLLPWLDILETQPGIFIQMEQEKQITKIPAAAVIVGQYAVANWQELQMYTLLKQFIVRKLPVIPVLLAGTFQRPELPLFLANFGWVDFNRQVPDPLNQLQWGITGKRP